MILIEKFFLVNEDNYRNPRPRVRMGVPLVGVPLVGVPLGVLMEVWVRVLWVRFRPITSMKLNLTYLMMTPMTTPRQVFYSSIIRPGRLRVLGFEIEIVLLVRSRLSQKILISLT